MVAILKVWRHLKKIRLREPMCIYLKNNPGSCQISSRFGLKTTEPQMQLFFEDGRPNENKMRSTVVISSWSKYQIILIFALMPSISEMSIFRLELIWRTSSTILSRYVTGHIDQLSLPSCGIGKSSTDLWLGLRRGAFTCVGWQVTLCDLMWKLTPRSSEMEFQ